MTDQPGTSLSERMHGSAVATKSGTGVTLYTLLEDSSTKASLAKALGDDGRMAVERFARIVLTQARQNPRLLECHPHSVLGAALLSAQLHLEPGPTQQAYLIPRFNKKTNTLECQFMVGYRGMIDLARRGGELASIDAQVVHENDTFDYAYGLKRRLEHVPAWKDAGRPIAAYAVATFTNGGDAFVVLPFDEIEKRRARSQTPDVGPWRTDWDAMARKTCIRALEPYLPRNPEFSRAVAIDDAEAVRTDLDQTLDAFTIPRPDENANPGGRADGSDREGTAGNPGETSPGEGPLDAGAATGAGTGDAGRTEPEQSPTAHREGEPAATGSPSPERQIVLWCEEVGITDAETITDVLRAHSRGRYTEPAGVDDREALRGSLIAYGRGDVILRKPKPDQAPVLTMVDDPKPVDWKNEIERTPRVGEAKFLSRARRLGENLGADEVKKITSLDAIPPVLNGDLLAFLAGERDKASQP